MSIPDGAAADKNFRPGDVIVEVQNQAVKSPDEVEARLEADAKAGKKVELLLVNRGGERRRMSGCGWISSALVRSVSALAAL